MEKTVPRPSAFNSLYSLVKLELPYERIRVAGVPLESLELKG